MTLNTILLQAQQQGSGWSMIIMMVAIFAIFYFFMIRPQNQRQKKIQQEREKLTKGSKVVTSGGLHGRVDRVEENTFVISIADGVKVTVEKSCVFPVANAQDAVQEAQNQAQEKHQN